MRRIGLYGALMLLAGSVAAQNKSRSAFHLTVSGLPDGSPIPGHFTCDGANVSPPLSWSGEPEGTQSFALTVEDQDARNFSHWVLWDIPESAHILEQGVKTVGIQGSNEFGKRGYGGPCPPPGSGSHTYFFRLYALDLGMLDLQPGKGRDALDQAMRKHVLAKAEFRLRYGRN